MSAAAVVRAARSADAMAIAAIYNEGIASRQATFETAERDAEDVAGWLAAGLPSWSRSTAGGSSAGRG